MKKLIGIICLWLLCTGSYAYEPAIYEETSKKDEYICKETIFISGEPITLSGTLKYSESGKGDAVTETYDYSLSDEDGNSVSRELTFSVIATEKPNRQVSKVWQLTDFSESIMVGGKSYTLEKYDFSKTRLDEIKPVGDYFAGNIICFFPRHVCPSGLHFKIRNVERNIGGDAVYYRNCRSCFCCLSFRIKTYAGTFDETEST